MSNLDHPIIMEFSSLYCTMLKKGISKSVHETQCSKAKSVTYKIIKHNHSVLDCKLVGKDKR